MRKFAFYLPQFHEIEENNNWWGQGFTEWTHVKNAKPLYKGHIQPIQPVNNHYYNLMDKKTVQWQTDLMKKYCVEGFIYYHYYFCGKMLLEKPAENLLKWKDIEQPFFFCWANHSWYKSWDGEKRLLIEQQYGSEKEWNEHFRYLLPFFKDPRYEKKENKPLFMLFAVDFPEKQRMLEYFDNKCREHGFDGLCLIETYQTAMQKESLENFRQHICPQTQYIFLREPAVSKNTYMRQITYLPTRIMKKITRMLDRWKTAAFVDTYKADKLYKIMQKKEPRGRDILHGVFFSWDNTPRHQTSGYVITPPSKSLFFQFMDSIQEEEYLFFNAWNEWAEGMVLEPTEHNGFQFLEWIQEWSNQQNP